MKQRITLVLLLAAMLAASCSDDTITIGNTLTEESNKLNLVSASFNVQTRTIVVDSILTGSNECYFGRVKDPETGTSVSSEFITQLNILESFYLSPQDTILSRYGQMAGADSCVFDLYMQPKMSACSDSLAAMKMRVRELGKSVDESATYFSNFDPQANGLVRTDGLVADKVFTYSDLTIPDASRTYSSTEYRSICVRMNQPYTDRDGETYNNYGTYVMQQYYRHPEYFKNSYSFIHNVCPGFFFEITDGMGFYSQIPEIGMRVFYQRTENDSIINSVFTLAGTDEVFQTSKISYDDGSLETLASDPTCTYVKSPAGLYTEVTLPVDEIILNHESDSLIASKISFQRINNEQRDYANLDVPMNLLMVHKDSLEVFFSKNKLNDNVTSYLNSGTSTNATNSIVKKYNVYSYENISDLIALMADAKRRGTLADPAWVTKHPNWNKVVLVPVTLVQTSSGTSATTTAIKHNMSLTSTKLVGGSQNPNDPIQINVVYARFK